MSMFKTDQSVSGLSFNEWRARREARNTASKEASATIGGRLGLLMLEKRGQKSLVRDWLRHKDRRSELEDMFAASQLYTVLLVMDAREVEEAGYDNFEKDSAITDLLMGDTTETKNETEPRETEPSTETATPAELFREMVKSEQWLLVEPLPKENGVRRWSVWDKTTAVLLGNMANSSQSTVTIRNTRDQKNRSFWPECLQMCGILSKLNLIDVKDQQKVLQSLQKAVNTQKVMVAGKAVISLTVLGCLVAVAACTGVGAITLSSSVAESVVKGIATSLGQTGAVVVTGGARGGGSGTSLNAFQKIPKPVVEGKNEDDLTLEERIARLELAIFQKEDEEKVLQAGGVVLMHPTWWERRLRRKRDANWQMQQPWRKPVERHGTRNSGRNS